MIDIFFTAYKKIIMNQQLTENRNILHNSRLSKWCGVALFLAILINWQVAGAADNRLDAVSLTFGVVPQQSATKLAKLWTPIIDYLSNKTGIIIDFKTAINIPTFEQRCANGDYDMAYMNPYHYTVFHETTGYRAFAREQLKSLKGIIVVRKDSPYMKLTELKGKTLAFPAPAAFAASVLPRTHLSKLGIHFVPMYVASHDSVYRTVAKGLFPAGGGVPRTFNNIASEIRAQLRILWTSKGYAPHVIAAHPRVPAEVVQIISNAMAMMNQDPKGKDLLDCIAFKGLVPAKDHEWNDVRDLGIDILKDLISHQER
jgi:phosphonate transport system substrate-binding protein